MPLEFLAFRGDIGKGDIRRVKRRLDSIAAAAEEGVLGSTFAGMFYTPETFAKRDPVLRKLLDDYVHISHNFKHADQDQMINFGEVQMQLAKEMEIRGLKGNSLINFGKKITMQSAQSRVDALDRKAAELAVKAKTGDKAAIDEYNDLQAERLKILTTSELQVNTEFIGIIENAIPKAVNKKIKDAFDKDKTVLTFKPNPDGSPFLSKDEIGKIKLKNADGKMETISTEMKNAVYEYMKLTDKLYDRLSNGVRSYIKLTTGSMKGKNADQLKEVEKNLLEKILPNREKGFYPHFSTDLNVDFMDGLMPKLEDLVLSSNKYFNGNISLQQAIDNVNGYISGHTKSREAGKDMETYSLNFGNVMKSYMNNVNRFNYINHINQHTQEVLFKAEKMYKMGKYASGYGEEVVNFIHDLHQAATGMNEIKNPQLNSLMRSVLGLEFISKIGFNPRSAVRNVSQSLLNLVEFGPIQMKQSNDFFKAHKFDVDEAMHKSGLLFTEGSPELTEGIGMQKPGLFTSIRWNEKTKSLEHVPITKLDRFSNIVSKAAGKSGWMMAQVENFNRKQTFKVGFSQMYRWLENSGFDNYVKSKYRDRKGDPDYTPKKGWGKLIESERLKHAKDYAVNMSVVLHFDYNAFSKAKALRGPAGKVLGQFQHYGFKFFEYNMNLMKNAKDDVLAGEFNGNSAWKAYRMGMVYFMAPVLASAVTGVDFGNLIEHDTSDRITKLWAGLAGDDEDRKKAFYGKGPVIGTIGAPVFSDLMNVGMMYNFVNMDEESLLALISGYQDLSGMTDDKRTYQMIRMLNTAAGRIAYRTLPQLARGNIGWAIQTELGLYPNQEAKEKQEIFNELTQGQIDAIKSLEEFGR